MSFLTALVAFAALIAVYSTIVTVIVEGLHRVFALRSAGMNEMLRAFYDKSLRPMLGEGDVRQDAGQRAQAPSADANRFAESMTKRLDSESPRLWYVRSWPLIGQLFAPRQNNMTTLQFIERLATTEEGDKIARRPSEKLQAILARSAYEFERLGEMQLEYFKSRAKGLSVVAGIVVALFVNFDAIAAYQELSRNAALSSRLAMAVDQQRLELLKEVGEGQGSLTETAGSIALPAEVTALVGDARMLGAPIGRKMFPHCEGYLYTARDGTAPRNAGSEAVANDDYYDARCGKTRQETLNQTWAKSFGDYLAERGASNAESLSRIGHWFGYRLERIAVIANNLQSFLLWVLGVIIAGALIGLGAPFWYRASTQLMSLLRPGIRSRAVDQPTMRNAGGSLRPSLADQAGRGASVPERLDEFERSFRLVRGEDRSLPEFASLGRGALEDAPEGRAYGEPPELG